MRIHTYIRRPWNTIQTRDWVGSTTRTGARARAREIVIAHLRRLGVLNGRRNVLHHCLGGLNVLERRVACLMLRCALHESESPSPSGSRWSAPGAAFV